MNKILLIFLLIKFIQSLYSNFQPQSSPNTSPLTPTSSKKTSKTKEFLLKIKEFIKEVGEFIRTSANLSKNEKLKILEDKLNYCRDLLSEKENYKNKEKEKFKSFIGKLQENEMKIEKLIEEYD